MKIKILLLLSMFLGGFNLATGQKPTLFEKERIALRDSTMAEEKRRIAALRKQVDEAIAKFPVKYRKDTLFFEGHFVDSMLAVKHLAEGRVMAFWGNKYRPNGPRDKAMQAVTGVEVYSIGGCIGHHFAEKQAEWYNTVVARHFGFEKGGEFMETYCSRLKFYDFKDKRISMSETLVLLPAVKLRNLQPKPSLPQVVVKKSKRKRWWR